MSQRELYKPEPVSDVSDVPQLVRYLQNELDNIRKAFLHTLPKRIDWLHAEPSRPREGDIAGADGIDWNPGSGEGVYAYYAGTWNKLG